MTDNAVYRKGYVYIQESFAGIIEETDEGYLFTYDTDYRESPYAAAVSLTLPLQKEAFFLRHYFLFLTD